MKKLKNTSGYKQLRACTKSINDLEKELIKINADILKVVEAKPWTAKNYNDTMLEIIKVTEWIEEKKIEQKQEEH